MAMALIAVTSLGTGGKIASVNDKLQTHKVVNDIHSSSTLLYEGGNIITSSSSLLSLSLLLLNLPFIVYDRSYIVLKCPFLVVYVAVRAEAVESSILGRFPKDEVIRLKWIQAIRENNRESFVLSDYSRICDSHFITDDYQKRPDLIKLIPKAVPSVFNCTGTVKPNIKQKRLVTKSNIKSVKKCYDYLSEHNYVLKLPDISPTSADISLEISVDPSKCMVQTLKVGDNFISEPYMINISGSRKQSLENPIIDLTTDTAENNSENRINLQKILEKNWRDIATTQTATIKNLKKKIKVLQQKIRRQNSKIGVLKNRLENVY
ncbi:Zinc finger, C2CH-type [Cinara cedri]|uniref:Zinc finger, C2CH-type n=1 Tax=Cinara cedri TaxID=506608 RepID=A0A5E4MU57_9HEMI|nr:Zinc finger, C2CH-type [Cinara cedri]